MVDGSPQIAILEMTSDKPSVNIWNCTDGKNGDFKYECKRIECIKDKLGGIEDRRTKVFHLLLEGTEEIKGKLDTALKEYEDGQSISGKKKTTKPRGDG